MPHPDNKPVEPDKPVDPGFGKPEHPEHPEKPEHPEHPEKPAKPDQELPGRRVGAEPRRTEKENLLSRIQIILAAHQGLESRIPFPHEYWALANQYRGMP